MGIENNKGPQLSMDLGGEHENYLIAEERRVRDQYHMPANTQFIYQDGKRLVNSPFGLMTPEDWDKQMKELEDGASDMYEPKKAS